MQIIIGRCVNITSGAGPDLSVTAGAWHYIGVLYDAGAPITAAPVVTKACLGISGWEVLFGTGKLVKSISPKQAADPGGLDVIFGLNYVMDTSSQDASSMQSDLFRSKVIAGPDYRRFQVSFDTAAIKLLPDRDITKLHITDANWLHELTTEELNDMQMDDVTKFDLVKEIGLAMTDYVMLKNQFKRDLNDTPSGRDELVTAFNNVTQIKAQIASSDWIDQQKTA